MRQCQKHPASTHTKLRIAPLALCRSVGITRTGDGSTGSYFAWNPTSTGVPCTSNLYNCSMDYNNPAITEALEIVKTVEFVLESNRSFRLEVVHRMKGTVEPHYDVSCYERKTLYKAPNGTISAESLPLAPRLDVWVRVIDLPRVNPNSADAALSQALNWLVTCRNNQNTSW